MTVAPFADATACVHPVATALPLQRSARGIEVVCLDIDGTLVDYDASVRAGLRAILGCEDSWSDWCQTTDRHYRRYTAGHVDFDTMRRQRTKDFFAARGEYLDDREVAEREERRAAAFRGAWRLYADVLPCLERLRAAGLGLVAVTNAAGSYQRSKLDRVGLGGAFDHVVISGEVGAAKPDPEIFRVACRVVGVDRARAVHVGDRLDLDAKAARAAGLHGIWLNRSEQCSTSAAGIPTIRGLAELPGVVSGLLDTSGWSHTPVMV